MQINGNAFHENAVAFGPCAGPAMDPTGDVSWACAGFGTERFDPLADTFVPIIVCGRCNSLREGRAIQTTMEDAA